MNRYCFIEGTIDLLDRMQENLPQYGTISKGICDHAFQLTNNLTGNPVYECSMKYPVFTRFPTENYINIFRNVQN